MKILVINGPNLNLIQVRDEENYGKFTTIEIGSLLKDEFPDVEFSFVQSNLEGEIISQIQKAGNEFDGVLINPGGYSHTSVAIRDALELCNIPKVEVHLSNLAKREDFRQKSLTAGKCDGYISGFKHLSYQAGVYILINMFRKDQH